MTFTFDHHLQALVYLHLQEYVSGRELLQVPEQDEFAKAHIVPQEGVSRSTFSEAMYTRALEQLVEAAPQCLPCDCQKPLWADGPNTRWSHHLSALAID